MHQADITVPIVDPCGLNPDTPVVVRAYIDPSEAFAVHRSATRAHKGWDLTHIGTGLRVVDRFARRGDALLVAAIAVSTAKRESALAATDVETAARNLDVAAIRAAAARYARVK